MSYLDSVTKELYEYNPPLTKMQDFDEFWDKTIAIAKSVPLNPKLEKYNYPSPYVKVYSITYNGFDETPIHGWYIVPTFTKNEKLPCVIRYHGFNGNRGIPSDFMHWIMMGVAVISVDCREQTGLTGNCAAYSHGHSQNVICKGILNKDEYYFRAVYMDCLKAIDFAYEQDEVDQDKIVLEGSSQGGALTMAVGALDSRPKLLMADVPSNSNITKRVIGSHGSFSSVTQFLGAYPSETDKVFEVLSYFDTMNLADRIKAKLLASVALKDDICPAKLYFASYNKIKSEKQIEIYPFNGHVVVREHIEKKLKFLKDNIL